MIGLNSAFGVNKKGIKEELEVFGCRPSQRQLKEMVTLGSLRTLAIEGSGREIVLIESRPSVGLGMDMRLASRKLTGFALSQEDQILHLAVFAKASQRKKGEPLSGMARFSKRRSPGL
jgi:hypothetical protein